MYILADDLMVPFIWLSTIKYCVNHFLLKYFNLLCGSGIAPGAIIGDGDRKRALILLLGLCPWYGTIFLILEQIAPSPVAHAHICCEDFCVCREREMTSVITELNTECLILLAHNNPQLNTFMSVGIWLQYFRRKLLQFEWSKTVLNLVMSCFIYHWPSYVPLLLLQELHITSLQVSHMLNRITTFP